MNEDCYHEQNSCYNSNSFSFDQFLPQQLPQKEEEEKQIEKEQAAKARHWKIPICYDDDEDYTIAITPKEPDNSLSMGDEHLDTISAMESDEFIKFSVENLVPNPSESKGEHECDVPACDDFTTFSNILFDETDTQEKDKNKARNDKTEHKMEKIEKDKVIRSRKVKSQSLRSTKVNPGKVKVNPDKAEAEKWRKYNLRAQICKTLKVVLKDEMSQGLFVQLKERSSPGVYSANCLKSYNNWTGSASL
nr:hypothetical protein [Tanacetum cinerariifolium]